MSFLVSNATMASLPTGLSRAAGVDLNALDLNYIKSPIMGFYVSTLMTLAFLAFLCYTPSVPKGVPEFTSEKYPIIGSYRFFTHKL